MLLAAQVGKEVSLCDASESAEDAVGCPLLNLFDKFLAKIYCLFGTLYISWTRRAVTTPRTRQGTNFMATPYNHRLIVNIVAESTKVAFGGNLDQFCF